MVIIINFENTLFLTFCNYIGNVIISKSWSQSSNCFEHCVDKLYLKLPGALMYRGTLIGATTLCLLTLSIMIFGITIIKCHTQHNDTPMSFNTGAKFWWCWLSFMLCRNYVHYAECCYAECRGTHLSLLLLKIPIFYLLTIVKFAA